MNYTHDSIQSLLEQGELLPIARMDENGEMFYTNEFAFADEIEKKYYIQETEDKQYKLVEIEEA